MIQIAPIKIDPWSALAGFIKKYLIGDIAKKLDSIATKVDQLESQFQESRALQARTHILRFADELYNKKEHSKEYFDDILEDIDMYDKYCKKHPEFENSKTIMSAGLIKTTYDKLMKEHKFL